jgi:hypothetical protein
VSNVTPFFFGFYKFSRRRKVSLLEIAKLVEAVEWSVLGKSRHGEKIVDKYTKSVITLTVEEIGKMIKKLS